MKKTLTLLACFLLLIFARAAADSPEDGLRISEVMAQNSGALFCADGSTPDWVELYNGGDAPVSLSGFSLTDDRDVPDQFMLGDGVLKPGEYLLICCTGEESTEGELCAPFKLSASGEAVYLFYEGMLVDALGFGLMEENQSYARDGAITAKLSAYPTPGGANLFPGDPETALTQTGVSFSEIMVSASAFKDDEGYDWVELRNTSSAEVDVSGYTVTLGYAGGSSYTLPDGASIAAGGQLVIYYTGDEVRGALSSGFALPKKNTLLLLRDADGNLLDQLDARNQYGNVSWGIPEGSDQFMYLETATAGKANSVMGYPERAISPEIGLTGGLYSETVMVTITASQDVRVCYTLDGSQPTRDSMLYTEPLAVSETTVLRAAAFSDTMLISAPVGASYIFGLPEDIAVVSLMTDEKYLFSASDGVMVKGSGSTANYQQDWEYPMQIEFFDADGDCRLNQVCGFCISGEVSRVYTQKSMALFARNAYGSDSFEFNPFPNRDFTSYKSFTLRSAGTEGLRNGIRFRDAMLSSLAFDTNVLVSDALPVLVYINGEFWGHYNIRERMNKYAVAQYEGLSEDVDPDSIDILEASGVVKSGSGEDYKQLSNFMKNNDLNDPEAMQYVLDRMDIDSYFDFAAFMMLTGNRDISNAKYYRVPGGKWKWILFDMDSAMTTVSSRMPMTAFMRDTTQDFQNDFDHVPFAALMKVPEMKEKFLTRLGELLAERFNPTLLEARAEEWRQLLAPLIALHVERWSHLTVETWNQNVDDFVDSCRERPGYIPGNTQNVFGISESEAAEYFAGFLEGWPE